ncbi:MAG: class I SAM-dependent methyltransferase [Deltaproteobacteria bacterium]|jgi:SAM-dependent methyltransferase|nr:class I SAM-dependent methyltransferase [Deltaproteobacteria bacterium]
MNKLLTQEEYWDSVAGEKEFTTPFQMELFKKVVPKEARILDVGCGYGRTLHELYLSEFTNLSGIDISKKMIDKGTKLYPQLTLKKYDDSRLPFENNSLDAVILLAVLTCIISNKEQEKLIDEIERVLKDDGVLYINDFLINSDQRNIDRYKRHEVKYNKYGIFELSEGVVLRHYTKMRIDELMGNFEKIIFESVIYTTMNGNKSNGLYYIGRKRKKIIQI